MIARLVQCSSASSPSRLPGLDRALNPYRGCEHSCAYCYAQDVTRFEMTHPWGGCVEVKVNIVSKLKKELERGNKGVYGLGTVTDPYQPLERKRELTRGCLLLLRRAGASVSILTKSDLILRDLDLLSGWDDVEVGVSVGIVDDRLASMIEPLASSPTKRFEVLRSLADSGISTYLMAAPIIRGVSDSTESLSRLVAKAADADARRVIWDIYNPKPLADVRLRKALSAEGIELRRHSPEEVLRIRSDLLRVARRNGIKLEDAF